MSFSWAAASDLAEFIFLTLSLSLPFPFLNFSSDFLVDLGGVLPCLLKFLSCSFSRSLPLCCSKSTDISWSWCFSMKDSISFDRDRMEDSRDGRRELSEERTAESTRARAEVT